LPKICHRRCNAGGRPLLEKFSAFSLSRTDTHSITYMPLVIAGQRVPFASAMDTKSGGFIAWHAVGPDRLKRDTGPSRHGPCGGFAFRIAILESDLSGAIPGTRPGRFWSSDSRQLDRRWQRVLTFVFAKLVDSRAEDSEIRNKRKQSIERPHLIKFNQSIGPSCLLSVVDSLKKLRNCGFSEALFPSADARVTPG